MSCSRQGFFVDGRDKALLAAEHGAVEVALILPQPRLPILGEELRVTGGTFHHFPVWEHLGGFKPLELQVHGITSFQRTGLTTIIHLHIRAPNQIKTSPAFARMHPPKNITW